MLVVAYAESSELAQSAAQYIRTADTGGLVTTGWDQFALEWPLANCIVVLTQSCSDYVSTRLTALRLHRPVLPLILVVPAEPLALRRLCRISADQVISFDRYEVELTRVAQHWLDRGLLARVIDLIDPCECWSELRNAVSAISRAYPPYKAVKRLEIDAGIDRRRLAEVIRRTKAYDLGFRLHDLLSAVFLMHACRTHARVGSWAHVATTMSVEEETLRKWAHDLGGCSLRDLNALSPAGAMRHVFETILLPFTEAGRRHTCGCGQIPYFHQAQLSGGDRPASDVS